MYRVPSKLSWKENSTQNIKIKKCLCFSSLLWYKSLSWESILVPFSRFLLWIRILKAQVWLKMALFQIHVWKPFIQENLLLFDLVHSIQDHCIFHKKKTSPVWCPDLPSIFNAVSRNNPQLRWYFYIFVMLWWCGWILMDMAMAMVIFLTGKYKSVSQIMQDKFILVEIIFAHFTAAHVKKHGCHRILSSLLFTFCQKESKLSDTEKVRTDQEGQNICRK